MLHSNANSRFQRFEYASALMVVTYLMIRSFPPSESKTICFRSYRINYYDLLQINTLTFFFGHWSYILCVYKPFEYKYMIAYLSPYGFKALIANSLSGSHELHLKVRSRLTI